MYTATKDNSLHDLLELAPTGAETLRIDTFDGWRNPDTASGALSWICYNRICHNQSSGQTVLPS